jgi:hypothetical protein
MPRSRNPFVPSIIVGSLALLAGALTIVAGAEQQAAPVQKPPAGATEQPREEGRKDIPLREFMRAKLQSSNKVLEGLVTDDPGLVQKGAEELNALSNAEKWRVSNDAMYRQFSSEFRRITEQLVEAGEKKNMDQAALKWVDATMSCIECHRFVRGIMIAGDQPRTARERR